MNFIKALIADALSGFVLSDIPFLLFRIFVSGLVGYFFYWMLRKDTEEKNRRLLPVLSMFSALIAICVEFSLPLAMVFVPVILLLLPMANKGSSRFNLFMALCVGVGLACGAGYVFISILALLLIVPLLFWAYKES